MKNFLSLILSLFVASLSSSAPPPPVTALAYHPDGKLLAAGTYREVFLIDPAKGEVVGRIAGQTNRATAIAFTATGDRLAVASGEPGKSGEIRFYEIKDGVAKLQKELTAAHKDIVYTLAFSPDGKLLASAGYDRSVKLWNASTHQQVKSLDDLSDTVFAVSFHPDGKLLSSASADRAVKVWDIESGKRLYTLSDPTDGVYTVAWSPDRKHLAAAGIDKSIRVWAANADGGKLVHSVFGHTQPITKLVYNGDGTLLFSLSEGKNVKSWNAATMAEKLVFPPQNETMLSIAIRPDQKQIAIGRFDGKLILLDATTGKTMSEPLPAKPKPPVLQKISPSFGQRGQTVRVTFEGQNLDDVQEIVGGLEANVVPVVRTSTSWQADVTFPANASPATMSLSLKSPAGSSAALPFIVDRYPAVVETGAADSPRIGMKVALPATLVGTIGKAGDADYFRFEAKAGQELAVQVSTTTIGSKLEPIVELTDANGKLLAESSNGLLGYRCTAAGSFSLGIRDREFRGGADFTYRISIGDFPIVTGVVPLSIQRGKDETLTLLGVNLGMAQQRHLAVPADAVPGSKIAVPLPKLAEKILGEAQIVAGEFPESRVVRDEATLLVPGTATGVIGEPGSHQSIHFSAKKGQRLVVEVEARRLGSPLDSFVEIRDAQDQPVQRATLRCVARTFSVFRDNDSAAPGIRLENWNELAIDDHLYVNGELLRIKDLPKGPDDDCSFYAVAGQRVGFLDTTPAHHAMGSSMYKVEMHPPGTTFPPNGHPVFNIAYRNDDGGPGFGKDSRLFFDPPADGDYRVRIGDSRGQGGAAYAYRLTVRPPRPDFSIAFNPTAPSVWKGGSVPIAATATRLDGYDGPISLKLENLPPGFEAPTASIEAGQTAATFALYAAPLAMVPEKTAPFRLMAKATIGGKEVVRESLGGVPKLAEPGDIVTTTNVQEVTIRPGQESKLLVTVERRNGFAGRIPIEVRGLPHGVRVLDIGLNGILITERDTQREIVIHADSWVKPLDQPIIVLARQEGKNTEHGAKSVLLKVVR